MLMVMEKSAYINFVLIHLCQFLFYVPFHVKRALPRHANLVHFVDSVCVKSDSGDQTVFIVMKWEDGGSLLDILNKRFPKRTNFCYLLLLNFLPIIALI